MDTNMIIPVSCTVYTYCVVQTYRILSVQFEGFGSSYIGSCCSSSYLYVLVLYLTLRNTPYLLIRYLRKLGNDHVQLCFSSRTNFCLQMLWKQTDLNETKFNYFDPAIFNQTLLYNLQKHEII